jgi:hypothetical protein
MYIYTTARALQRERYRSHADQSPVIVDQSQKVLPSKARNLRQALEGLVMGAKSALTLRR